MADDGDGDAVPASPPLPKRGAYNIDFDNLDDSINPFASKKTLSLGSSPPIKAAAPVPFVEIDDPFKSRTALSSSPPGSTKDNFSPVPSEDDLPLESTENDLPPPPLINESEDIEDPFKSRKALSSSPLRSESPMQPPPQDDAFEDIVDPFKTKPKVAGSIPPPQEDEFKEEVDSFKSKPKVKGSPPLSQDDEFEEVGDPFKTKRKVAGSPPLPQDDAFEEVGDPFKTKRKVAGSPPLSQDDAFEEEVDLLKTKEKVAGSPPPTQEDEFKDIVDPFKTKPKVAGSPPKEEVDPFKTKPKVAASPPGSPKVISQNNNEKDSGFASDSLPEVSPREETDELKSEDVQKQDEAPKKKKMIKKPKAQSKFRPPKNFKKPPEGSDEIEIFMPDPTSKKPQPSQEVPPEPQAEPQLESEVPKGNVQQSQQESLPEHNSSVVASDHLKGRIVSRSSPDPSTDMSQDTVRTGPEPEVEDHTERDLMERSGLKETLDTDRTPKSGLKESLRLAPFLPLSAIKEILGAMERTSSCDENSSRNDRTALAERKCQSMDLNTYEFDKSPTNKAENQSLFGKFDPLNDGAQEKSSKSSGSPREHSSHLHSDNDLLMNSPSSPGPQDKHPATRALEHSLTHDAGKKSSGMAGLEKKEDGDAGRGQVVQLVQVLRYSQTDWNKMKQELELNFQTSLLNKERDWSLLLGDRDKKLANLEDHNRKLKRTNEDMRSVVAEFEKTISQLQTDKERNRTDSSKSLQSVELERDQALEDLQSVESAFSDLHRRYEKSKTIIEGFKRNEEQLKGCVSDLQEKLKKSEVKLQAIHCQAEEKLDKANEDIDKVKKSSRQDIVRLEAGVKKAELRISGLEDSLIRKEKENEELTAICDELISKVGS